jgi:probable rRNA maturation factor
MTEDPPSRPQNPALTLDLIFQDKLWLEAVPDLERLVRQAVEATFGDDQSWAHLPSLPKYPIEVSFCFAGDDFVRDLNRDYRDKDKPTNVLSFPSGFDDIKGDFPAVHVGDVVLARGVVLGEAKDQKKEITDHTSHLVIHGLLHLLGFDHEEDEAATEMEALEIKILDRLGILNPYG